MKLTVITATFNCKRSGNEDNLVRCIKSVARLKTTHEHLIYDGASTDGTVELLRDLEKTTPSLKVVSEPDTGIYNALNKGVRDANGEWFYVLGADDYISHPEVMDGLLDDKNPMFDVVVAPVERDVPNNLYGKPSDMKRLLWQNPHSHQGIIMKTMLVRGCGGFEEKYKICADWEMSIKTHEMLSKYLYTSTPFAFYATGGFSENPNRPSDCQDRKEILQRHLAFNDRHWDLYRKHLYLPSRLLKYLFHEDMAFRLSSRWMLLLFLKAMMRKVFYPLIWIIRFARRRFCPVR